MMILWSLIVSMAASMLATSFLIAASATKILTLWLARNSWVEGERLAHVLSASLLGLSCKELMIVLSHGTLHWSEQCWK